MTTSIREATVADAEGIAHVHVSSWRSTYRWIMPDALLAGLSVERRAANWRAMLAEPRRSALTLVVEHPLDGVIGFADAGTARDPLPGYDAELFAVYLLEQHQRGGLGRGLIHRAASGLLARGYRSLFLWVLAANEARNFYAALGGQQLVGGSEEFGGVALEKLAYGWPDLHTLLTRAGPQ